MDELETILSSPQTELEKLVQAFQAVSGSFIEHEKREIEVLRALGDQDQAIKEQIKLGVMETARQMFQYCHYRVTGKQAWHEQP